MSTNIKQLQQMYARALDMRAPWIKRWDDAHRYTMPTTYRKMVRRMACAFRIKYNRKVELSYLGWSVFADYTARIVVDDVGSRKCRFTKCRNCNRSISGKSE